MDRDRPRLTKPRFCLRRALAAAPLSFFALFFVWPLVSILWHGLGDDPGAIFDTLAKSRTQRVLWFTFWQATVSCAATITVGLAVTWLLRWQFPGRALVRAAVSAPFVLPTVVVATAFLAVADLLGLDKDPVRLPGTAWAIIVAHVYFNVAVVVRTVSATWDRLDPRLEQVAGVLGASPWRTFREVTLPRLRPALVGAGSIVYLFSFTSFGVVLILGGGARATLDTEIWRFATQRTDVTTAAALGLVQLLAVVISLVVARLLRADLGTEQPAASASARRPATVAGRVGLRVGALVTATGFVGPLAILGWRSLQRDGRFTLANYRSLVDEDPATGLPVPAIDAITNSLLLALIAAVLAVVLGLLITGVTGGAVADLVVLLPIGTSAVLVGFGMLIGFDSSPIDWRTTWWIVPVAHATVATAFVVAAVRPVLSRLPSSLRWAAASLGARPGRVWWEVDLPIARRAILVGGGFAVAISLGEFGATAFLARPQRPTITSAIFGLLGRPGEVPYGQALALCMILSVLTIVAVSIGDLRLRRRHDA